MQFDSLLDIIVASDGIEVGLLHKFKDRKQKSCSTSFKQRKNYSQIEKKALAIIFAVKKKS